MYAGFPSNSILEGWKKPHFLFSSFGFKKRQWGNHTRNLGYVYAAQR